MDGQGAKSAADCPYTTDYYPAPLSIICLHEWGANPSTWYRCLSGSSSHPDVLPYKNCPYKTTRSIFLNQGASTQVFAHQGRTRRVREGHPPGTIVIPVVLLCSQPLVCLAASCSSGHTWWRSSAGTLSRGQDYILSRKGAAVGSLSPLPSSR